MPIGGGYDSRTGGSLEPGQELLDGVTLVLTPITPPGPPVSLVTGTTWSFPATSPYAGFDGVSWDGAGIFFDHPLAAGDVVDVSIDMTQPALAGLGADSPTTVRLTYDPAAPPNVVQFNLRPVLDLPGSVFVETGTPNGVQDGTDFGIPLLPISLWR